MWYDALSVIFKPNASNGRKLLIAAIFILLPLVLANCYAHAGNQDHTCQGGHNCNQGEVANVTGTATATGVGIGVSSSDATSDSQSHARSNSDASAVSSSGGNRLSASTGESTSSATAGGGDSSAAGGSSSVEIAGDVHEVAAASAASVFASHCQSGASGQIEGGGFSVVNSEQFCDYIRMAAVMWEAYERELKQNCMCEGVCTSRIATVEMVCEPSDRSEKFLDAYYENLWDAQDLLQATEETAVLGRATGQLSPVLALLGILVLL